MVLRLLPDAELVAVEWLRNTADVTALVADRVYTAVPPEPSWPLIRVLRVGGTPVVATHLDVARLQIDCWATDKQAAHLVARTVQAALHELPGTHPTAVVTAVEDGTMSWNPDDDYHLAGYTADYLIYLHPIPGAAGS